MRVFRRVKLRWKCSKGGWWLSMVLASELNKKDQARGAQVFLIMFLGCKCDMLSFPLLLPPSLQGYNWIYPRTVYQNKLFLPKLFLADFDHSNKKDNEYSCLTPFVFRPASRIFFMGNVIRLPDNCQILLSVPVKSALPNLLSEMSFHFRPESWTSGWMLHIDLYFNKSSC